MPGDIESGGAKDAGGGEEPKKNNNLLYMGFAMLCVLAITLGLVFGLDNDVTEPVKSSTDNADGGDSEASGSNMFFNRASSFFVCEQLDPTCNVDNQTVSEIVSASDNGNTAVYTDSELNAIGFIDLTDATMPKAGGTVSVGGEPTSVAVLGNYALAGVNTSPDFVNPSGNLAIVDMTTRTIVRTMDLGGQPDSVAVSPDGMYAAIAIENERDEDLNNGLIPQLPAGFLVIIDTADADVNAWTMRTVDMTGLDGVLYPSDPEPEYVSINADNVCAVTLQENNAIVLVDLASGSVTASFSAGSVDLTGIDVVEDEIIDQTGSLSGVLREPDAIAWIGTEYFATADEGDLDGGSRGFTIFDTAGTVVYTSGNEIEREIVRIGHYPDGRAENKGGEPEAVLYAEYGDQKLLFVNAERSGVVFVYDVADVTAPVLHQALPTGLRPEGLFAIPSRNLFMVACEEDARADKVRAQVNVYSLSELAEGEVPDFPMLRSVDDSAGNPIAFSALSGLSYRIGTLYSIEDSFYARSRIIVIDPTTKPASVTGDVVISDANGALAAALDVNETAVILASGPDGDVSLDLEGVEAVMDADGNADGFWLASEGSGTVGDVARPVMTPNLLLRVGEDGIVTRAVRLPASVDAIQVRFGLEGVAVDGDVVVVAFQRAWGSESGPRLGIYDSAAETWRFVLYPLDAVESQNGGWVGLSDLVSLGGGSFLVLERDNQGGFDAAIKRIYRIELGDDYGAVGISEAEDDAGTAVPALSGKTLQYDLLPDLKADGRFVAEKIEGMAMDGDGNVWVNNDNDGVDDNAGEQLLFNIGPLGR